MYFITCKKKSEVDCIKYFIGGITACFSSSQLTLLCSGSPAIADVGSMEGPRGGGGTLAGLLHWGNQTGLSLSISLSIGRQTVFSAQYSTVIAPTQLGGPSQQLSLGVILGSVMSYRPALGPHRCPLLLKLFI